MTRGTSSCLYTQDNLRNRPLPTPIPYLHHVSSARDLSPCVRHTNLDANETQVAVTGGADSFVRVWDARTGDNIRSLIVEGKEVLCVRPWPGDPDRCGLEI